MESDNRRAEFQTGHTHTHTHTTHTHTNWRLSLSLSCEWHLHPRRFNIQTSLSAHAGNYIFNTHTRTHTCTHYIYIYIYIYIYTHTHTLYTHTHTHIYTCWNSVQMCKWGAAVLILLCFLCALLHFTSSYLINHILLHLYLLTLGLRLTLFPFPLLPLPLPSLLSDHMFVSRQVKLSRSEVAVCKQTHIDTRWEQRSVWWLCVCVCVCGWVSGWVAGNQSLLAETSPLSPPHLSEDDRGQVSDRLPLSLSSSFLLSTQIKRRPVRVG